MLNKGRQNPIIDFEFFRGQEAQVGRNCHSIECNSWAVLKNREAVQREVKIETKAGGTTSSIRSSTTESGPRKRIKHCSSGTCAWATSGPKLPNTWKAALTIV